jgi:hypothetical protein
MTQYTRGQRVRFTIEGTVRQNGDSEDDVFYVDVDDSGSYAYIEVPATIGQYIEIIPEPLPTEPGLYGHRGAIEGRAMPTILHLDLKGEWTDITSPPDVPGVAPAPQLAQMWHDRGDLVRLGVVK